MLNTTQNREEVVAILTMPNSKTKTRKRQGAIRQKRIGTQDVDTAFEMLLDAIDAVKKNLQREIAQAANDQRFDESERLSQIAQKVDAIQNQVKTLQNDWAAIFSNRSNGQREAAPRQKGRKKKRLERGHRTPEDAYRRPILEALVELGGSAPAKEVLELVEQKMRRILNNVDYQSVDSGYIRWMVAARWCRKELVREGLMRKGSPRGIWEITEQGRRWLEQNRESDTL